MILPTSDVVSGRVPEQATREAPQGRLLILNPNSSREVSRLISAAAERVLPAGIQATVKQSDAAPTAIQTLADRLIAEPLALEILADSPGYDAYVMACFDNIALAPARRFLASPVVGAVEASVAYARLRARRFAVVTTVNTAIPGIRAVLRGLGAEDECAVRAADLGVTEAAGNDGAGNGRIDAAIAHLRHVDKAEAVILGSAGLTGRAANLSNRHGIEVIDAMEAAIRLAVSAMAMGSGGGKIMRGRRND